MAAHDPVIVCGRHAGETYECVWKTQRSYCDWAVNSVTHGSLLPFAQWCEERLLTERVCLPHGVNASEAARRIQFDAEFGALLPALDYVTVDVHAPTERPAGVGTDFYGTYMDYFARHHLSSRMHVPFTDFRAESVRSNIEDLPDEYDSKDYYPRNSNTKVLEAAPFLAAYASCRSNINTRAIAGDIFRTSLAHSAFFMRDTRDVTFHAAYAPLATMDAVISFLDTLSLDGMRLNPAMGNMDVGVVGDADLLCDLDLIDIKTSTAPTQRSHWVQLFVYAALHYANTGTRLHRLVVYSPLAGKTYTLDISGWLRAGDVNAYLQNKTGASGPGSTHDDDDDNDDDRDVAYKSPVRAVKKARAKPKAAKKAAKTAAKLKPKTETRPKATKQPKAVTVKAPGTIAGKQARAKVALEQVGAAEKVGRKRARPTDGVSESTPGAATRKRKRAI